MIDMIRSAVMKDSSLNGLPLSMSARLALFTTSFAALRSSRSFQLILPTNTLFAADCCIFAILVEFTGLFLFVQTHKKN